MTTLSCGYTGKRERNQKFTIPMQSPELTLKALTHHMETDNLYELIELLLDWQAENETKKAPSQRGSFLYCVVGAAGFEPTTSPTRTVRATGLRHAPITVRKYTEIAPRRQGAIYATGSDQRPADRFP